MLSWTTINKLSGPFPEESSCSFISHPASPSHIPMASIVLRMVLKCVRQLVFTNNLTSFSFSHALPSLARNAATSKHLQHTRLLLLYRFINTSTHSFAFTVAENVFLSPPHTRKSAHHIVALPSCRVRANQIGVGIPCKSGARKRVIKWGTWVSLACNSS